MITIGLDFEEVVKALFGDSKFKGNVGIMLEDCRRMMSNWEMCIKIGHKLREGNKCANKLAKLGQVRSWGMVVLEEPSNSLREFLLADTEGAMTSSGYSVSGNEQAPVVLSPLVVLHPIVPTPTMTSSSASLATNTHSVTSPALSVHSPHEPPSQGPLPSASPTVPPSPCGSPGLFSSSSNSSAKS
nr:putative ribonuclease H protein [Ipomoea batatas]